jgi:hypothetical protein
MHTSRAVEIWRPRAVEIRVWKTPLTGHPGFPDLVLCHADSRRHIRRIEKHALALWASVSLDLDLST